MHFLILFLVTLTAPVSYAAKDNKPTILECIRKMEGVSGYSENNSLEKKKATRGQYTETDLNKIMLYKQLSQGHNKRFIRIIEVNNQVLGLSEIRDKDPLTVKLEVTNILTGEVKTDFINERDVVDVTILENGALVGIRKENSSTEIFVKMGELDVLERLTIEGQHIDVIDVLKFTSKKVFLAGLTKEREMIVEGEKEKQKVDPVLFLIQLDFKNDQITAGHVAYKHSFWSTLFPVANKKRISIGDTQYKYIEIDGQIHFIDSNGALVGVFAEPSLMKIKE